MTATARIILLTVTGLTAILLVLWQATGGDYYTKYQVVEQVQKTVDPDDPLAAAGFYEGGTRTETVVRDEFRFGLLPTPRDILDKHSLSVVSIASPAWLVALFAVWRGRLRK
jgi:hypothetical protein